MDDSELNTVHGLWGKGASKFCLFQCKGMLHVSLFLKPQGQNSQQASQLSQGQPFHCMLSVIRKLHIHTRITQKCGFKIMNNEYRMAWHFLQVLIFVIFPQSAKNYSLPKTFPQKFTPVLKLWRSLFNAKVRLCIFLHLKTKLLNYKWIQKCWCCNRATHFQCFSVHFGHLYFGLVRRIVIDWQWTSTVYLHRFGKNKNYCLRYRPCLHFENAFTDYVTVYVVIFFF